MEAYTPVDREDLEQEAALARWLAQQTGFDPEVAAAEAMAKWAEAEVNHSYRCRAGALELDWLPEAKKLVGLIPARARTEGQRRKAFRDQLILVGSLAGFSQRDLATALDLPHSRIHAILDRMRDKTGIPHKRQGRPRGG